MNRSMQAKHRLAKKQAQQDFASRQQDEMCCKSLLNTGRFGVGYKPYSIIPHKTA